MKTITVDTGYRPRLLQADFHRAMNRFRFSVAVCHRRFGKTVMAVNHLIDKALLLAKERENPRVAYIAPLYRQAKTVAWDYLKHYTAPIPGRTANEAELRVDLPGGGRVTLYGADNPDSLRGIYLDWVVLDEFAQMRPQLWGEVIRPTLTDRAGGALFIGTPKGHNEFHERYQHAIKAPDWHGAMYRASETGIIPASELVSAHEQMTADEYAQEFECSFEAAIKGAYYGVEMRKALDEGRIGIATHQPGSRVTTAWDLGIGDATAIWFAQWIGQQIRIIDYYEATGEALPHYAKLLDSKPYLYGDHWLPHDARARELGTGKSRVETLLGLGLKNIRIAPNLDVEDGINAVRLTLPRCWFDDRCLAGVEALRQYRSDYDERGRMFKNAPLHDWSSHAADAFRYLCVAYRQEAGLVKPEIEGIESVTMDQLWKRHGGMERRI